MRISSLLAATLCLFIPLFAQAAPPLPFYLHVGNATISPHIRVICNGHQVLTVDAVDNQVVFMTKLYNISQELLQLCSFKVGKKKLGWVKLFLTKPDSPGGEVLHARLIDSKFSNALWWLKEAPDHIYVAFH